MLSSYSMLIVKHFILTHVLFALTFPFPALTHPFNLITVHRPLQTLLLYIDALLYIANLITVHRRLPYCTSFHDYSSLFASQTLFSLSI